MKKARIMLMAIAFIGVVGGALAFKSTKSFGGTLRICTTPTFGANLLTCVAGYTFEPLGASVHTTVYNTTTTPNTVCGYLVGTSTVYCTISILNTFVYASADE